MKVSLPTVFALHDIEVSDEQLTNVLFPMLVAVDMRAVASFSQFSNAELPIDSIFIMLTRVRLM